MISSKTLFFLQKCIEYEKELSEFLFFIINKFFIYFHFFHNFHLSMFIYHVNILNTILMLSFKKCSKIFTGYFRRIVIEVLLVIKCL